MTLCSRQPPGPQMYRCAISCYRELQAMTRLPQHAFSSQLRGCRLQLWWTILRWLSPEMWSGAPKTHIYALHALPLIFCTVAGPPASVPHEGHWLQ